MGEFADFPQGFSKVGQPIPPNFGTLQPVTRTTAKFGLAVTFQAKDFNSLGKSTATPTTPPASPAVAKLTITTSNIPSGKVGTNYSQKLAATGGKEPYTWSGTVPDGLTLDAKTGFINGSPKTAVSGDKANYSVTVTDSSTPQQSATKTLNITIDK